MKRILSLTISVFLLLANVSSTGLAFISKPHLEIGFSAGLRTIINSDCREVYGNGINFFPSIAVIWNGLMLGTGYEGGFKRNGLIGIYEEPATLRISGIEVFTGYQATFGPIHPLIKIGYGFYSYKQLIDSPYIGDISVDGKKSALIFSGGVKIDPVPWMFVMAEVKYGNLKVKPYEIEVDLGGMRLNGGIGFRF